MPIREAPDVVVVMKTIYAGPRGTARAGDKLSVPAAEADRLVAGGFATRVEQAATAATPAPAAAAQEPEPAPLAAPLPAAAPAPTPKPAKAKASTKPAKASKVAPAKAPDQERRG